MDGSAVGVITDNVTITSDGLLALIVIVGLGMGGVIVWHLRECSRRRGDIYGEIKGMREDIYGEIQRMDRLLHKIAGKFDVDTSDDPRR